MCLSKMIYRCCYNYNNKNCHNHHDMYCGNLCYNYLHKSHCKCGYNCHHNRRNNPNYSLFLFEIRGRC